MSIRPTLLFSCLLLVGSVRAAEPIPLEAFVKPAEVDDMSLSPDGRYLALRVPSDDRTALVVLDRATLKPTASLALERDNHVDDYYWATADRLVVSPALRLPGTKIRVPTGELWGVSAAGKRNTYLFGYRGEHKIGTRLGGAEATNASAFVLEGRADERERILVGLQGWNTTGEIPFMRLHWMNVNNGKLSGAGTLPVRYYDAHLTDHDGHLRFISGYQNDRQQQLYWRPQPEAEWQLLNDERESNRTIEPLAYTRDGQTVYARIDDGKGPAYFARFDPLAGTEKVLLRPKTASVGGVIGSADRRSAFALQTFEGRGGYALIDGKSAEAALTRMAMASFPGEQVIATSFSDDARYATVFVYGDVNPGAYYLYDQEGGKLTALAKRYPQLDPARLAPTEPFTIESRDGLALHGLLTRPNGAAADQPLPMVVLPHGGPYGVVDRWGFDPEVQLLASRGYAVLQLNFRGSGDQGRKFVDAGIGEWGNRMQDDLTDATRWAIEQKAADPRRICIYGTSYGGYAALMGAVAEPELYRCAIGAAGVYDLALMKSKGDIRQSALGRDYLDEILEKDASWLARRSPAQRAGEIKAAVMLIHGGLDKRVPPIHAERMRDALKDAGNEPQWLYEAAEGHGFADRGNRLRMYEAILAFLDQQIGAKAKPAVAAR